MGQTRPFASVEPYAGFTPRVGGWRGTHPFPSSLSRFLEWTRRPGAFAADAHDCILVRSSTDRPNIRLWLLYILYAASAPPSHGARKLGLPDRAQNRYPGQEAMIIRNNLNYDRACKGAGTHPVKTATSTCARWTAAYARDWEVMSCAM
jgi:hypothetical protein